MGSYRFFYCLNWVYRSNTELNYRHHWLVYLCGGLQTLIYGDFFYQYCRITTRLGLSKFEKEGVEASAAKGVILREESLKATVTESNRLLVSKQTISEIDEACHQRYREINGLRV